ncbi:DNA primase [Morganella morganii]|uniref:DNA primase n=1 Tax=Morganella morganii TaxID=582 RepID=A0A0D8L8Y7_MORMO|nr:DNA primase [Morganella morganii]
MGSIDLIRAVKLKANGQWQGILSAVGADLPVNTHTACPGCGGKDRFRFDDKDGNGTFICNQCGAGDGLDLVQRVLGVGVTEAAKEVAGIIGIDTRSDHLPAREQISVNGQQESHRAAQQQNEARDATERLKLFTARYSSLLSQVQQGEASYLAGKGLTGFMLPLLPDGSILIPLMNVTGTITGAQMIKPDGGKRLLTDSTKKGSYYPVNAPECVSEVIIAEGLATALTCHLIRPDALTVAAMDAGNLIHVAKHFRDQYARATLIIAADNDADNTVNTGREKAEAAAWAVNGQVTIPATSGDWNDVYQAEGLDASVQAFNQGMYQVQGETEMTSSVVIKLDDHREKERDPLIPFVDTRKEGLYYVTPKLDKETGEIIRPEQWLSDPMKPVARGMNEYEEHYLIVEYGRGKTKALPNEGLGDREGWKSLRRTGVNVTAKPAMRNILSDWLDSHRHLETWSITHKSGWHKGAYIMPDGSVIGTPDQPVLFNGQSAAATAYRVSGTPQSWRDEVARLADGNIFMMFAIGAALAAPMTGITMADSFGIHIYAQSTAGKSTTADMAVSLYGHPDLQRLTWYGTAYGIANEAVAHNDGLLYLDEVGQGADPKHVYKSAYTLFNGKGKIQGAKDGGNRPMENWRTVAISTGEKDIETYLLNAGVKVNAGQLVRLLNIPIERAVELHECESGKHHADTIKVNCRAHYGSAGRHWIEYLSAHKDEAWEAYHAAQKRWNKLIPANYGEQVHRASDRFAMVEAALLTGRIITGWSEQDCRDAVQAVFNVWLAEFGTGNKEIEQIVEQATAFLNTYGMSRYAPLPYDERDMPVRDLAGYRERKGGHDDAPVIFYTLPSAFKQEMAKGFNAESFAAALTTIGMLKKPAKGKGYQGRTPRLKHLGNTQQRAYVMMLIPDEEE